MWLKQFQTFHISFNFEKDLEPHLSEHILQACPPHTRMSFGWKTFANQELSQSIHDYHLCLFGKEERILPSAVIQNLLDKKTLELNQNRGYPVKRHEKQQLKQDLEFEMLPKAFCVQKKVGLLFDSKRQRLYIESTSPQQIEMILAFIHKTIGQGIEITQISAKDDLLELWMGWLFNRKNLPHFLELSDRMQWVDSDNHRKQIRCQGYDWEEDSVNDWLKKGLIPQELSFTWREKLQFSLTPKFIFKRVQALPSLQEELDANEIDSQDELSNLLMIGHLYQQLLDDLGTLSKENHMQKKADTILI